MSSTMPVRVQVMCIVIVVTSPRRLSLATSLTVWRRLRQGRPSSGLGDLRPQGGRSTCRGPVAYGPVGPHRACAVADLKGSLISTRDVWALPLRTFGRWPRTDARIRCSKKSRRARLEQGENDASPCLRPSVVLNRDGVDHRAAGRRRAAVLGVQLREQQRARPARCPEDLVPTQGQPGAGSAGDRALPEPVRGSAARQRRPGAGLRQPLRRRAPQGGRWRKHLRAGQQPGAAKPHRRQAGGPGATLFRGETLRGLLLNAYAFWKVGQIALVASIASFALAGVMLLLTVLGFWHLRRVGPTEELMAPTNSQRTGAPA